MSQEQHFQSSEKVRDFVIGLSDGLTVPFALAAGLSGAVDSTSIVITAGLAEIAAGSIAMGLGGYLAGRTEIEHYDSEEKREYEEIEKLHEVEIKETKEIFAEYGLNDELQEKIAREMAKNPKMWVDFMMRFELGLERPNKNRASKCIYYWNLIRDWWSHPPDCLFLYRINQAGIDLLNNHYPYMPGNFRISEK
jgi:vacuolar iron transporter family protein